MANWTKKIHALIPRLTSVAPIKSSCAHSYSSNTDYTVDPHYVPGSVESIDTIFWYDNFVTSLNVRKQTGIFDVDVGSEGLVHIVGFFGGGRTDHSILNSTEYSPMPVLHAVSAFGTTLCFYKMCRDQPSEARPIPVRPELRFDMDATPQERWDINILEDEGKMIFESVVKEIKQAYSSLRCFASESSRRVSRTNLLWP